MWIQKQWNRIRTEQTQNPCVLHVCLLNQIQSVKYLCVWGGGGGEGEASINTAASKASTTLIVSKHNEWSTYWFYIPLQGWPTSSELFDQSKQRWLLQRVCLVCADMLRLAITGGVCSGSPQANQKGPEGQNQRLIRCVWGTMRKRPLSAV